MKKRLYSNTEIIKAIKSNKADKVLLFLYKSLEPKIRNWIRKNNGNKQEAQDIFQDSILAFYSYVIKDKFDPNSNLESFIFVIAKNKWINYTRSQSKKTNLKEDIGFVEETSFEQTKNKQGLIDQLLKELGETCKEILTYTIFYNLSMEDVCIRLGFKNPNTAKTKNYKCKQRLKNLINANPEIKKQLFQ